MRYRFMDGYEFEAETPDDICGAIWHSMKFCLDRTLAEWTKGYAKMIRNMFGFRLRTDTTANHVADMLRDGVIARVDA